jgi:hypothetical protein
MSSPPNKYIKSHDYAADNANLNVDFDRIKSTTDQTIDRLALIQRDDGALRDFVITTNALADGAVTTPKLADLSVTTPKLADLSVTTAKLGLAAVGYGQLQPSAVNSIILAQNAVGTIHLIDGSVTSAKLAPGAVLPASIPDGSLTGAKIQDGSIGNSDLSDLSISTAKLQDLSVTTPKLADAAVTSLKLAASLAFTGIPTAPTAATGVNTQQLATTAFVAASMSAAGMITEAPNDGKLYGRFALGWQRGVAVAGDTMTGLLLLSADPAAALGAATKQYADTKVAKAGDTMTGNLAIKAVLPAWGANFPAVSLGQGGAIGANVATPQIALYNNLFYDGANYKYIIADAGGIYAINGGIGTWWTAPAGAAGANAVPVERMRLDANGNLGLRCAPPAWQAGMPAFTLGGGGSIVGQTGNGSITLYNNVYHDGANYKFINADGAGLFQCHQGFLAYYNNVPGAAGASALSMALRFFIDNTGQVNTPGSRGNARHTVKDHVAANAQVTAFKWPMENSNLSTSVRIKVTAVNDDTNGGYATIYREACMNYSYYAGSLRFFGGIGIISLAQSVNSGVIGIGVNISLVESPAGTMNLTVQPVPSGGSGFTTARLTCSMELVGVDDYQSIQAMTGSS